MSIYAVNGKEPIAAWIPSLDTAGNGTTTLTDLIGSNNGTLQNMDPATDWVADTNSGGVRALDFDSINDTIAFPTDRYTSVFNSNIFTVSIWCLVRDFGNFPVIFANQNGTSHDSALLEWGNTGSTLYTKTGTNDVGLVGARIYTISPAITINTWCHIVFVKTGTGDSGNVYVNGSLLTSWTGAFNTCGVGVTHRIWLASYGGVAVRQNGRQDDIRIFNEALNVTDVAALYATGLGRGVNANSVQQSRRRRQSESGGFL